MSTDQKTTINATPLVQKVEFNVGVSQKTGNAYVVGACFIKSPISEAPIRLGFDYIDPNTQELIKMAADKFGADQEREFAKDIN